ncbi:MAG: hypothetical protein IJN90_03960 [Bacilli bacterium]|nr:hypothetical protein [Bacilli bacterium]
MEGKKTILFLANGFGMEAKDSYSLGDDLIPTVTKLSQEYMFTGISASGKECGFSKNQVSAYKTGYSCFSNGGYVDLAVQSMDKRILENNFIDQNMLNSIDFAVQNKSKMHVFFMIGDKFSYSTGDQLKAFVKKCVEQGVKRVCIHLFVGYNSERGLKTAKDSIKAITRTISEYENVKISLIVGVDQVSDSTSVTNLSKIYKICTTSIGETWPDWQELFDTRYKAGVPDEQINPFLIRREVLFESNDSIFIFNYESMPITRYLSIIVNPKQLFNVDTNPTNIKITSLLPIQEKTTLAHCYEYDMPTNYFTKDLETLGKKATLIADSSRAGFINSVLNGNRNEISPFLNTKSVKINNDYFAEMTQILLNEIQNGQDEIIIIDYNLMNDYKKGDVEKLRFNFGQMDKALRKVYEYTYKNHHRLIFTSLYGVKEEAIVKEERVLINYANRVPYIIVDDEYTRNTALLAGDSISLISQTLLYVSGDKKRRTMVILKGKGSSGNLKILLIGFIILVIMIVVKLLLG